MENIKNIIAENIITLRKQNKLTQAELAEKLNYTDKAVSKWERGESVPDITVLKELADTFGVTVDFLLESDHTSKAYEAPPKRHNRIFITGLAMLLVWLIATVSFAITDIIPDMRLNWLAFVYAVPVSLTVWLIFSSLWFSPRKRFIIISLLVWSVILSVFFTLLPFGTVLWQVLLVGIPAQAIVILWSKLKK